MPVLKHSTAKPFMKDAIVLDMGDLEREAQRILNQAREQAASVLEDAKREAAKQTGEAAEIGRAKGMEQGLTEGRAQGREEGRREVIKELQPQLAQLIETWSAALEQWEKDRAEMLLAARQDVLAFAIEMGRKVTIRAVQHDPSIVEDQLAEALSHVCRPTAVTIAVHPDDRPLVEEVLPQLLAKAGNCTHASIIEEPSMARGGCVVGTGRGVIDASIETQIERIVEALLPPAQSAAEPPP